MGARLVEIDSKVQQPSDTTVNQQSNLPSFSDRGFRDDLHNLPKDTQANDLPELKLDEYDYRSNHPIDANAGGSSGANKLPDVRINNNRDYDVPVRRPADSLPNLEIVE